VSRGTSLFVAGLLAVLAAVGLGYLVILAPAASDPVVTPAARAPLAARLAESNGTVEVRQEGGDWAKLEAGGEVAPGADVRTALGSSAALALGNNVKIRIDGKSQVRLADLSPERARFTVGEGFIFADVLSGGPALQFVGPKGDAVAETKDGALYLSANDKGELRAAVTRGEATLSSNGEQVLVRAGYVAVAAPGRAPSSPSEVPRSLLLKVRWPTDLTTAKRRQLVTGSTAAGARVVIGDQIVWADEKGKFESIVELSEGKNRVVVTAVDAVGRKLDEASPTIELDTRAPRQTIETSPAMWGRRDGKKP
jgi:hypothetical protein